MRIENVRLEEHRTRIRSAATVVWEDCARPPQDIYFETENVFADGLWSNPDAFLTVCLMPALWHGEVRLQVDGRICPELRRGLLTTMGVMRSWHGLTREPVRIEAQPRPPAASTRPERAGFFFSAGVDSLATLRLNHLNFPADHPGYIKDGLLVYGMEVDRPEAFEHVLKTASLIAEAAGITMIPVYTNARALEDEWDFWIDFGQGAVFAAVAHSLSRRLTTVSIASSYDVPHLHHTSTHPLIDPNYSSWDLRIKHDAVELPRVEKIRLLADWDVAINNVRVCNQAHLYKAGSLNCARCEKCVRTMMGFLIAGVLDRAKAFPKINLSEDLAERAIRLSRKNVHYYDELISPLQQIGRDDLARCIRRKLERYHRGAGWKAKIARLRHKTAAFDEGYLNGNLKRVKHLLGLY